MRSVTHKSTTPNCRLTRLLRTIVSSPTVLFRLPAIVPSMFRRTAPAPTAPFPNPCTMPAEQARVAPSSRSQFDPMTTVRLCLGMVVSRIGHGDGSSFKPDAIIRNPDTFRLEEEPTHPVSVGMHIQLYYIHLGDVLKFGYRDGELAVVEEIEAVGRNWTQFRVRYSMHTGFAHLLVPSVHATWSTEWVNVYAYLEAYQQLPTLCSESPVLLPKGTATLD
ncbi:hypothetical protein EW026_g5623 [Hermanssonia centrifuga]|uniref:Uncharacterized protein n=1 Tax=Hermanssonia centrifuga TaxID=98765 RepID=A0A4S4KDM2_9APHY|nr:hypothetical protein EW026_g5623 [Hermanssonia centrifuga]